MYHDKNHVLHKKECFKMKYIMLKLLMYSTMTVQLNLAVIFKMSHLNETQIYLTVGFRYIMNKPTEQFLKYEM